MLSEIINILISGVSVAAVYAVMAIGLGLVYGVARVFNFAYGSFLILGAYLAWLSIENFHLSYPIAFVIVIICMFLLGIASDAVLIRPLRGRPHYETTTYMITLALALVMDNTSLLIFGPHVKRLPLLFNFNINLGGFSVSANEVGMLAIAMLLVIALEIYLARTRQGMSMRAVAQDVVGAQIVGIPINNMYRLALGISAAVAGVSGVMLGSTYFMSPLAGWSPFCKAFIVVAFGGLGSLRGSLYAAFILGITEALVAWRIGGSWVMVFWFLVLIGVLAIRPRGLLGKWG